MSLHREHQHFDVIGSGFVHERHADDSHRHLGDREQGASGSILAWLAFYAPTALVVASTNGTANTANVVLASAQ